MKKRLLGAVSFIALNFLILMVPVSAATEKPALAVKNFSITPSPEWMELPLPLQNVVVSYGKKGTLATFHIIERDLDDAKTVQELQWKNLFSPQFDSIDIRQEGETSVGGEKARYCIYHLKPGAFKLQMEGKLPAKYMNYVVVHGQKLFSITFKDTEDGFALNYPSFLAVIRTLQFGKAIQKSEASDA